MDQIKGFPWKQLRTLGIYKHMGSHRNRDVLWGWDYITVMCSRIVNSQMGFRSDDIEVMSTRIKKKGRLLHYLFGHVPDFEEVDEADGWPEYFKESFKRCIELGQVAFGACCVVYLIASLMQRNKFSSIVRGFKISATIGLLGAIVVYYLSISPWGRDIKSGIGQESPFIDADTDVFELTLPVKKDVLFSTRLDSPFLAGGQNLIYKHGQPGNELYGDLLSNYSVPRNTAGVVAQNIVDKIMKGVKKTDGRFLLQNVFGDWEIMDDDEIVPRVVKNVVADSNPILKSMEQEIRYLVSECKHGRMRETVLFQKHAPAILSKLENALFEIKLPKAALKSIQAFIPRLFVPHVKKLHTVATAESEEIGKEPLKEGDVVEAFFANDGWFKGRVTSISRRRGVGIKFAITFEDGDYQVMKPSDVRKFDHYKMGEQVEDVASSQEGTISYIYANGRVAVDTVDGETLETHVHDIHRS